MLYTDKAPGRNSRRPPSGHACIPSSAVSLHTAESSFLRPIPRMNGTKHSCGYSEATLASPVGDINTPPESGRPFLRALSFPAVLPSRATRRSTFCIESLSFSGDLIPSSVALWRSEPSPRLDSGSFLCRPSPPARFRSPAQCPGGAATSCEGG